MDHVYLLVKDGGHFVGSCFSEEEALKGAEEEAEDSGMLTCVVKVPILAAFGPLSRLESGGLPPAVEGAGGTDLGV